MCDCNHFDLEEMDRKTAKLSEYMIENYNLQVLSYSEGDPKNVISLNLTNTQIKFINVQTLSSTPNLQIINLSHNLLTDLSILSEIDLPRLKTLDLKYNQISDFSFLSNLQTLEELDIRGNHFDSALLYWTVSNLPKLRIFNGEDITEIRRYLTMAELQVISSIDNIFSTYFSVNFMQNETEIIEMKSQFVETLMERCYIIGEAKIAIRDKIEKCVANKLKQLIDNIMKKIMSNENFSNNIVIKPNVNLMIDIKEENPIEELPKKLKFTDFQSDILAKAIAEAIGELNVEINSFQEIDLKLNSNQLSNKVTKTEESLDLSSNNLKRKAYNQINPKTQISNKTPFPLSYDLIKILKHSSKTILNNFKTSIWSITFKPFTKTYSDGQLVVSCGANVVNIIDLKNGSVERHYEDSNCSEVFNCIVWREFVVKTANGKTRDLSLLCVGGTKVDNKKTDILFLNADDMSDYFKLKSHYKSVNCLLFHPYRKNILFSGSYDKRIMVWSLDSGKMTEQSRLSSLTARNLMKIDCNNRILNTVFAKKLNILVVSGEDGIVLISLSDSSFHKRTDTSDTINTTDPTLTYTVDINEKRKLIDGLVMMGTESNLLAFRLKDKIIITDLEQMMASIKSETKGTVPLIVINQLRYCPQVCDYFYMTIESRLMSIGTAEGQTLLYYLKDSVLHRKQKENLLEPIVVLSKPDLKNICTKNDFFIENFEKWFINIAVISPNHEYIVCGTNSNMICVWKRSYHSSEASNKKLKTVLKL